MKKKYYLATAAVCISMLLAHSQGIYFNLKGGYGFPSFHSIGIPLYYGETLLGNTSSERFMSFQGDTYNLSRSNVCYSYGQGANIGLTIGYAFNQYIGVEMGFIYVLGSEITVINSYSSKGHFNELHFSYREEKYNTSGRMYQFIPSIVINPGLEKWNPYVRFGAIFGIASFSTTFSDLYEDSDNFRETIEYTMEYTGGIAFGFTGGLGIEYILKNNFTLFAECNVNGISYAPKQGKITELIRDDVNSLPSMSDEDRTILFVDEYTSDGYGSSPTKSLKFAVNYSTITINLGIKIRLGK